MLEFYNDFLNKFFKTEDFLLCEMDTERVYLALSTNTPDAALIAEMLKVLYEVNFIRFLREICLSHRAVFIPQSAKYCNDFDTCLQV